MGCGASNDKKIPDQPVKVNQGKPAAPPAKVAPPADLAKPAAAPAAKPAAPPAADPAKKKPEPPPVTKPAEEKEKKTQADKPAPVEKAPEAPAAPEEPVSKFAKEPGLGDDEFPGFPAVTVSDTMPDLSQHNSFMSDILSKNPDMWGQLKDLKTPGGVPFAKCIKTGMDNKGHPMIKTVGMVAGDEDSYQTFKLLFDPVIDQRHGGYAADAKHNTDLDYNKLSNSVIDPEGKYVISTRVRTGRSIRGIKLPPSCSKEERREIERVLSKALKTLDGELKGDYYPLAGSYSYAPKPGGMTEAEEDKMRADHFLFQEPDSTLLLASGMGRQWPDARGIFANDEKTFLVWCNEEDHMRIISMQMGANIKQVFTRFCTAVGQVEKVVKAEGYDFMHNDHLGYILTCPSNLGTGLRASVMIKVPLLSKEANFKDIMADMKLQARGGAGVDSLENPDGIFDISNADRIGFSEVELVNTMIEGCCKVIELEQKLERGESLAPAPEEPAAPAEEPAAPVEEPAAPAEEAAAPADEPVSKFADMAGLGDDEYPGFPADVVPDEMPDLSEHNSFMSEVLQANPDLWGQLKELKTPLGIPFAKCIKTGMDNKGHPMIKTVGMVAGDEESYEVFKAIFDPVIDARHGGYPADATHPTDLDFTKCSDSVIDPDNKYVLSTRVRTGRSIKGIPLPPSCSKDQRREIERVLTKSLKTLDGELEGDYYPLAGSYSYADKPGGMSEEEENKMREDHFLFQEPDSTLLLSSGMGRHWPDARGIFANNEKTFLVWCNEEDHMRIISMQKGADIKQVFQRFCVAVGKVEEVVKAEGYGFMHSDHLGYILTCPSNLGTGLRASVMIKVPLLSKRDDFKSKLEEMKLQARGGAGVDSLENPDGIFDISNADRIGLSEVQLVNIMIEGVCKVIEWEQKLEAGEEIE